MGITNKDAKSKRRVFYASANGIKGLLLIPEILLSLLFFILYRAENYHSYESHEYAYLFCLSVSLLVLIGTVVYLMVNKNKTYPKIEADAEGIRVYRSSNRLSDRNLHDDFLSFIAMLAVAVFALIIHSFIPITWYRTKKRDSAMILSLVYFILTAVFGIKAYITSRRKKVTIDVVIEYIKHRRDRDPYSSSELYTWGEIETVYMCMKDAQYGRLGPRWSMPSGLTISLKQTSSYPNKAVYIPKRFLMEGETLTVAQLTQLKDHYSK